MHWRKKSQPPPPHNPDAKFAPVRKVHKKGASKKATRSVPKDPRKVEELAEKAAEKAMGKASFQALRQAAYLRYVTDPDATVASMQESDQFRGRVALSTMLRWSQDDDWVGGRKAQYARVRDMVLRQAATETSRIQLGNLGDVRKLKGTMVAKLESETFEGEGPAKLVLAYCKLLETEAKLVAQTFGLLTPVDRNTHEDEQSQLSDAEAHTAALAVLKSRRDALVTPTDTPKDAGPSPGAGPPGASGAPGPVPDGGPEQVLRGNAFGRGVPG